MVAVFGEPGPDDDAGRDFVAALATLVGDALSRRSVQRRITLELEAATLLAGASTLEQVGAGLLSILSAAGVDRVEIATAIAHHHWRRIYPVSEDDPDLAATVQGDSPVFVAAERGGELLIAAEGSGGKRYLLWLAGETITAPDREYARGLRNVAQLLAAFIERLHSSALALPSPSLRSVRDGDVETLYEAVYESLPVSVSLHDTRGALRAVNSRLAAAGGHPSGSAEGFESSGDTMLRRLYEHELPSWLARVLATGEPIFDLELVEVLAAPSAPVDVAAPPATAKTTPSGLSYVFLVRGNGRTHPRMTDRVTVNYWAGRRTESCSTRPLPEGPRSRPSPSSSSRVSPRASCSWWKGTKRASGSPRIWRMATAPAPELRIVDDVVVDQRGRVDELDHRRVQHRAVAGVAAQPRDHQQDSRPHTLSAARLDVLPDAGDEIHLRLQVASELALERRGLEIVNVDQVNLLAASEIEPRRLVRDVSGDGILRIAERFLEEGCGLLHVSRGQGQVGEAHEVLLYLLFEEPRPAAWDRADGIMSGRGDARGPRPDRVDSACAPRRC